MVNSRRNYYYNFLNILGVGNAVPLDQFGEQTYIRYGKSPAGLLGISLNSEQDAEWGPSHHICNMVALAMENMCDNETTTDTFNCKHKEEGKARKALDHSDRNLIKTEFQKMINPFQVDSDTIVNIYNGAIAVEKINVQNSIEIGEKMAYNLKTKLPTDFHSPIKKEILAMSHIKGLKFQQKLLSHKSMTRRNCTLDY